MRKPSSISFVVTDAPCGRDVLVPSGSLKRRTGASSSGRVRLPHDDRHVVLPASREARSIRDWQTVSDEPAGQLLRIVVDVLR